MKEKIKKYRYIIIGFGISLMGYIVSRIGNHDIANLIYFELKKWEHLEIDELIMCLFVFFLFIMANVFVLLEKQNHEEKQRIYQSMLYASNHILNTFLYQSQILKFEAEEHIAFNKNTIEEFDQCAKEAEALIKKLSEIENMDKWNILISKNTKSYELN